MRTLTGLVLIALMSAPVAPVAQPAPYGVDPHRYQVERHKTRMEALTREAEAQADTARRVEVETRLRLQDLGAARQPPTPYVEHADPPADPAITSERHHQTRQAVTQIDDWLDRIPD